MHMQRMPNFKTLQSTPGPVRTRPSTSTIKIQLTSFTCSKCNSTFDNKHRMKIHIKSQHEGKHTLSPERNVQKQFQKENAPKKGKHQM